MPYCMAFLFNFTCMPKIFKQVIEPIDFIWDYTYPDNLDLFEKLSRTMYRYDCYSFKILPIGNYNTFTIKVQPRLEIFTMKEVLLIGELSIKYHLFDTTEPLQDIIYQALESAHKEFIMAFDMKNSTGHLDRFKPQFEWEGLTERIRLSLRQLI